MTTWIKNNVWSVATQAVSVLVMGLIALSVSQQLNGYVRKDDWMARNAAMDGHFDKLEAAITASLRALQDSVILASSQYISQSRWNDRNIVLDDRLDKLERVVSEGRVERMIFQKDVVDRLARIETLFSAYMTGTK